MKIKFFFATVRLSNFFIKVSNNFDTVEAAFQYYEKVFQNVLGTHGQFTYE